MLVYFCVFLYHNKYDYSLSAYHTQKRGSVNSGEHPAARVYLNLPPDFIFILIQEYWFVI